MPDKNEKERRKQLLNQLKSEATADFEKNLPMDRQQFNELFEYLDAALGENGCDDTNRLTRVYLLKLENIDVEKVLIWLEGQGGYCDCEVLANVEQQFE